jgi:hypothetical protein
VVFLHKSQKIAMKIYSKFQMWKVHKVKVSIQKEQIKIVIIIKTMQQILNFNLAFLESATVEETPQIKNIDGSKGIYINTLTQVLF